MERNLLKNGLVNFFIMLAAGIAGLIVSRYSNIMAGEVACVFLGLGVLISGVSWFQMRMEEMERLEKMEFDELTRSGATSKIFNVQEAEAFPARRSRELFEKYFVRGFTVVLFLLQGLGGWWIWSTLQSPDPVPVHQPLMAMALLGMFALVLYLIGKYSSGLARLENQRLLRPGSSYLLLGAYFFALAIGGIVAGQAGFPKVDHYLAYVMCGVLGLLSLETLVSLLLEIYRPRIKGQVGLLLYESRLAGLLSHPEGLFATAAHALDYQFGFKVSETWFYRFLERALTWIILVQVGLLMLSTCFIFLEPGEQALLERFGKPVSGRALLRPGLHFKWPWPIDKVYRHRAEEILSFTIGMKSKEEQGEAEAKDDQNEMAILLWTVAHYDSEYHLLVASRSQTVATNQVAGRKNPPVNLLSLSLPVQYRIKDLQNWVYNHNNTDELLKDLATRAVVRYLGSADMTELMSTGRFPAAQLLQKEIQAQADDLGMGVQIVFLGLQDIHPPVGVAAAYEEVVSARQARLTDVLEAQAFAAETSGLARASALRIEREAEAERRRLEVDALARSALFTNQIPAYQASPVVYAQRAYLETLAEGANSARKIILAHTNSQDVFILNLEEKVRSDLFDVPVPGSNN